MVELPPEELTLQDIAEWYEVSKQLADLKAKEGLMRGRIVRLAWGANLKEGSKNTFALPDDYKLKGEHSINRKLDEAAVVVKRPQFTDAGIRCDQLFKPKLELSITEYRQLTDEQRLLVDQVLEIKPGSTALEIVPPKAKK